MYIHISTRYWGQEMWDAVAVIDIESKFDWQHDLVGDDILNMSIIWSKEKTI